MLTRLIAATALTLALGSASFAQTSATQGVNPVAEPDTTITSSTGAWTPNMNSAFYNDDGTTLRSEMEIRSNWSKLSPQEQQQVKADCAARVNEGATENTGRSGSAGQDGARTEQTAISQICKWTESL